MGPNAGSLVGVRGRISPVGLRPAAPVGGPSPAGRIGAGPGTGRGCVPAPPRPATSSTTASTGHSVYPPQLTSVRSGHRADQKSTGGRSGPLAASEPWPTPSFSRILFSISAATSG